MDKFTSKPVSRSSLSKQIAEQIRQAIIDGTLNADERLPTEEALAQQYSVSRPTIREALKSLAAQKLITTRRGPTGGSFINKPSINELSDSLAGCTMLMVCMDRFSAAEINQSRRLLEQLCCKLATVNRGPEDLEMLRQKLNELENPALTPEEFSAAEIAFYRAIVDATGNRMLSFIMSSVLESMQNINKIVNYRFSKRQEILSEHRQLFSAIERSDADLAAELINQQIDYIENTNQDLAENSDSTKTFAEDLEPI